MIDKTLLAALGIDVEAVYGREITCHCGGTSVLLKLCSGGLLYFCASCGTRHGAHPDGSPMGKPADAETRALRRKCHDLFDRWIALHNWSRNRGYRELSRLLGMSRGDCHFGKFDLSQCRVARDLLASKLAA